MVAMLLIILFISATGSDTIMRPIANTVDCYIVEGSVVKKEIDNGQHKLYVEVWGSAEIVDDVPGYILWVSEGTYDTYEVGDTYDSYTCEWETLMWWQEIKQTLVNEGIIEPFTEQYGL